MSRPTPGRTHHGELPRSPFDRIDELSCYYDTPAEPNNVLCEVLVPGAIDYPTLRRAVDSALAATPRARGRMAAGGRFRRRYTWEFPAAASIDPLSRTTWSNEHELLTARVRFMARSPSLGTSPPVRLLLATGPDASCLMLNAHHAALDGISCAELLRDIADCYRALTANSARTATCAEPVESEPTSGSWQLSDAHVRRYPFSCCRDERVGSPGVDRRDHAVPVLPPCANRPHRRSGVGGGARALGRD